MNEILEKVKSHFGVVDTPYYGPTYILPDGYLLNLLGKGHHSVVEHYLIDEGISNNKYIETGGSPTIESLGCIRCDMVKYYIGLSKEFPTREQYNSLLIWLDSLSRVVRLVTVMSYDGSKSVDYIFTRDFISDDVVDRIRRFYISGNLYEQLDDSIKMIKQNNFRYKREPLGEPLKQAQYQELKENLKMDKEHLKIYFALEVENVDSDYSDIESDDERDVAREGVVEFTRYKLDTADWVNEYDYDWDSESATVEIWLDPDTKLTKEEINDKVEAWRDWYYEGTIIQYGAKHDYNYYEEPWYDEHEADATLFFSDYEWVPDEEER